MPVHRLRRRWVAEGCRTRAKVRAFLKLFPQFRGLEADLEIVREANRSLVQENARLLDRVDAAIEDRKQVWETLQGALKSMETSYQAHINAAWQRQNGGIPYPEAPHLPPQSIPKQQPSDLVGRGARMLPSQMVANRTQEYLRGIADPLSAKQSS